MPRPHPIPLAPRHRRDWRTAWRRCVCGCAWPCPDRHLPVPVEPAAPPRRITRPKASVPAASAAWAVSGVADELREAYVAVGSAVVLLERLRHTTHPALHAARRSADEALSLADEAERLLGLGVQRLGATDDRRGGTDDPSTTAAVVGVRLRTAADRIDRFPHRIRVAGEQLRAAGEPSRLVEAVLGQWSHAAERLERTASGLRQAVAVLGTYSPSVDAALTGRWRDQPTSRDRRNR